MKFSLSNSSEFPETIPGKQVPFLVLVIAVLVTGTIFIWTIHQSYKTSRLQNVIREETVKNIELQVSGENLNESSRTAVEMAAITGNLSWEKVYLEVEPKLIKITEDASASAETAREKLLAVQILEARKQSAETENLVFALLNQGKTEEAQKIASGDDYAAQKKFFSDSLGAFVREVESAQSVQADKSNQNAIWLIAAEIILLAFFVWSWLAVIDNLRKSRRILLAKIDENKRAAKLINQSEERFRSIVETTSEWIWAIDLEGRITYSNPAIEKNLGYTPDEIKGKYFADLVEEKDRSRISEDFKNAVANNQPWVNLTHRWLRADQSVRYLESSGTPAFDGNGKLTGYRGASHDVTKRKHAEWELQKNNALLSSAFDATDQGLMVVDLDNVIVTYNKHFTEMIGIPETLMASLDNKAVLNFAAEQFSNAGEFLNATENLIRNPEQKRQDLIFFKDGRVCERYSQPHYLNGKIAGRVLSFRDITERRRAEVALLESQDSYQQLFDSNPHPLWVYDFETLQILAVNNEAINHYGYSREEFLLMTLDDLCAEENSANQTDRAANGSVCSKKENYPGRHRKRDGTVIDVEISSSPITFAGRQAKLQLATDVTGRKLADAALRESEYKLRTLLDNMNEGLSQVDKNQTIEFVNDRFCEMTAYRREELIGRSIFNLFFDEEGRELVEKANEKRSRGIASQYEVRVRKKSGEILWVIVGGAPIINAEGELTGSMGVFTDITERKMSEEKLLHDALHDGLTGLANRSLFINHLQKTIERGKRSDQSMYAVLFLDFDRFKVVNDSLGHSEGDNLLKQIARRLENLLRGGDLLARLSGDEFTILLGELNDMQDAVNIAKRIQEDLNSSFKLGEQEIFMSASIGIALSNVGHTRAEDMLRDADIAMYRAKAKGKAQHQVFDETMHAYAINRFQLETELHHALQRGEFSLSYQPIVDIETNNLSGFEALIRWNHPERGVISPGDFIPTAEENGLVIPLGRWILYESCRQLREWQKRFDWTANLMVSVNLSCKQFLQPDLAEQVTAALISTQLDPHCLKLEITESHVMENSDKAVTMMNKLRSIGVGISLDDFGTGYSSLSYLHRLPVNYLKIDRSFVSRMIESRENREIVYTIVKLAQNLRMKVIAEGIENNEQFEQLKNVGCEYGQGYFISKPLTAEAAANYLINIQSRENFVAPDVEFINAEMNM